jgi:hypothetical protein
MAKMKEEDRRKVQSMRISRARSERYRPTFAVTTVATPMPAAGKGYVSPWATMRAVKEQGSRRRPEGGNSEGTGGGTEAGDDGGVGGGGRGGGAAGVVTRTRGSSYVPPSKLPILKDRVKELQNEMRAIDECLDRPSFDET